MTVKQVKATMKLEYFQGRWQAAIQSGNRSKAARYRSLYMRAYLLQYEI